jgi:hypothetical protein
MHADEVQDAKLPEHDLGWEALRADPEQTFQNAL